MKISKIIFLVFFSTVLIIHVPASTGQSFPNQNSARLAVNSNWNSEIHEAGNDINPPAVVEDELMPYSGEGISDPMNVSNKTAIRMRLFDQTGVAMADGTFHTIISAYAVYFNGEETLEPLAGQISFKEVEAGNPTDVLAMFVPDYVHTYPSGLPQGLIVQAVVQACDVLGNSTTYFADGSYRFKIGTGMHDDETIHDPNPGAMGDICTTTLDNDEMYGTRMEFPDSLMPQPYFGPSEEVPPLPDGAHPYGSPLNLQPPMIFTDGCLSLFIPIQEGMELEQLSVWRYEPGIGWKKAEAGDDWLEGRIDHISDRVGEPSTVELCMNHFTGVQLTVDDEHPDDDDDDDDNHFFISGSCFIATAAYGSPTAREVVTLRRFRDTYLMKSSAGRGFVKLYYWTSPPFAKMIARHRALRAITRAVLTPILWACKLSLLSPYVGLLILSCWMLFISLIPGWLIKKRKKQEQAVVF